MFEGNVRFTVLGAVEVSVEGRALPPLAPRHRAFLGYLLLHSGTAIGIERLSEAIWGPTPPETARAQVHAALTAIRRTLRAAGADRLLRTRPAGYVIDPEPGQLDVREFSALVTGAESEPDTAVGRLREALALWRGPAFAGVHAAYTDAARARLEDRRLGALERLAELELAAGRHEQLLDQLAGEVAAHPLRERLARQLMLALHHAGRQADALAVGRDYRRNLADAQGLDPGPAFLAVEKAVLRGEPPTPPPFMVATPPTVPPSAPTIAPPTATSAVPPAASPGVPPASAGGPAAMVGAPGATSGPGASAVGTVASVGMPGTTMSRTPASAGGPGVTAGVTSAVAAVAGPGTVTAIGRPPSAFLPYDVADFAGRSVQVEELCEPAPQPVTIHAIDGMAGIGKTALAVHAAHRLAERYPDAQLFIDLQAHTAGRPPLEPGEALEVLLRQAGVPAERIPASEPERAALWRAELAGRRVLLVLDNAVDAAQVRPLLPGASTSLVLITSRHRLTDLDGARPLSMDVLPLSDAAALFAGIVGERADAEPETVTEVLLLCGFLPLAVRIAATRLRHRPRWSVAHLAERLRDERRRLTELATSERGVAAAFTLSYRQLPAEQQRLFRLVGLHPGRDITPHAAAALAGLSPEDAADLLEELLDAHMLQQHAFGRYLFHDLLRRYAAQLAAEQEPPEARQAALARLLGHQLSTAAAAMDVLYPDSAHRRPGVERSARPPFAPGDASGALAWLDAERANLVLAADQDPGHASALATTLYRYLYDHAHHDDALILYGKALRAARHREDAAGEGRALTDLGWVHQVRGRHDLAREHFERALAACAAAGDRRGEARALVGLGRARSEEGDHEAAGEANLRALRLFRELGDAFGEAVTLDRLGVVRERLGRYAQAADLHRQAVALSREIGSGGVEADALDNLGVACARLGRHAEAREHHERALELYRRFGYRRGEAKALNGLAEATAAMGEPGQAARLRGAALDLAVELGDRREAERAADALPRVSGASSPRPGEGGAQPAPVDEEGGPT
ncbi:tetratricopeptide repeat protein [Nonomuraea phyllanthi]|uniref:Tetratricopeptide repeat protein n=1 Tax=Nonomuraea phyllanthi TaxID=2219224 RepID=A0A5C4WK85_9ACTN|nr:BTAD domain-containing putative transcriptional regulator [Nonomuraea phyllanthi]KAB8194687.1 tetratricopeptide repeat protein [Nonomuraea phyllanthi]